MYADNHRLAATTRVLLERVRSHWDATEEDGCALTDDEIVARGLAMLAESLGLSGYVCAADVARRRTEPCS